MRLIELEPRWYCIAKDGDVVGLTFLCPHCKGERIGVEFDVGLDMRAQHPGALFPVPADGHLHWHREGDTFDTLTLSPSLDASACGHWHGFVTNGEIVGGI